MDGPSYRMKNLKNLFSLEGKTAIITGGGGATGFAIAKGLASFGANIVLCGRTQSKLDRVKAALQVFPVTTLALRADCSEEKQCRALCLETVNRFRKIDILVTAASLHKRYPAIDYPMDAFDQLMESNVKSAFLMNKAVGCHMMEQGGGHIVNISSARISKGHTLGYSAFAASKAAVSAFSRQLAVEWAPHQIHVNCIAAPELRTTETEALYQNPASARVFTDQIPFGRMPVPEELIGTAVFLASGASDFITGQTIFVDGGSSVY